MLPLSSIFTIFVVEDGRGAHRNGCYIAIT